MAYGIAKDGTRGVVIRASLLVRVFDAVVSSSEYEFFRPCAANVGDDTGPRHRLRDGGSPLCGCLAATVKHNRRPARDSEQPPNEARVGRQTEPADVRNEPHHERGCLAAQL